MTINLNYGNRVTVIPALSGDVLKIASLNDIKVLLAIASESGKENIDLKAVADSIDMDLGIFVVSLNFWQNEGVINMSDSLRIKDEQDKKTVEVAEKAEKKKESRRALRKTDEIPRYTTEELSVILEKRSEASHLIDECQQIFGKMFNTHEINIILGLVDYLALGWDYVAELLGYCARLGKHSVNYVERTAFSFVEDGIDTVEALKIKIAELEVLKTNENFVRKLFGMKSRSLTAKEKKCISKWFGELGYGEAIVTKAYELTVAATNEASMPYANAILERWYADGFKTLEDVENAEKTRAETVKSEQSSGSFDTDDFFEAALKRSYNK